MLEWSWMGGSWVAYGHPRPDKPNLRTEIVIKVTEFGYFEVSRDGQVTGTEGSLADARRWAEKCNVRSDYVMTKNDDTARLKNLVKRVREILTKALQRTAPFDPMETVSSDLNLIHTLLLEEENR